jgi:hypothetical protein
MPTVGYGAPRPNTLLIAWVEVQLSLLIVLAASNTKLLAFFAPVIATLTLAESNTTLRSGGLKLYSLVRPRTAPILVNLLHISPPHTEPRL